MASAHRYLFWTAVAMSSFFVEGCSTRATCIEGMTSVCACTDGRTGAQRCGSDGTFDACTCTGSPPDPGKPRDAGADAAAGFDAGRVCAPLGCAAIDMLFVIDNSGSMASAQTRLRAAVPGFLASMQTALAGSDLRVMVVDSDADGYLFTCEAACANATCREPCGADECIVGCGCEPYRCGAAYERERCDTVLGAGVVFPVGGAFTADPVVVANRPCGFPADRRWAQSGDPDFAALFSCATELGTMGNGDERPLSAMVEALRAQSAPGGCNAGFVRDEALLVVVVITDAGASSPDLTSGRVETWRQELLDAKCGREEGVVFIAVTHDGSLTPPSPPSGCFDNYSGDAIPLVRLAESFGARGAVREICSDFGGILTDVVVPVITGACSLF